MKTIIRQEVEKRGNNDDDAYKLIGAEIKRRRVSQSQTLSSVATEPTFQDDGTLNAIFSFSNV